MAAGTVPAAIYIQEGPTMLLFAADTGKPGQRAGTGQEGQSETTRYGN
jgi:hypothetical protein